MNRLTKKELKHLCQRMINYCRCSDLRLLLSLMAAFKFITQKWSTIYRLAMEHLISVYVWVKAEESTTIFFSSSTVHRSKNSQKPFTLFENWDKFSSLKKISKKWLDVVCEYNSPITRSLTIFYVLELVKLPISLKIH